MRCAINSLDRYQKGFSRKLDFRSCQLPEVRPDRRGLGSALVTVPYRARTGQEIGDGPGPTLLSVPSVDRLPAGIIQTPP
jgi:hypothetical protein